MSLASCARFWVEVTLTEQPTGPTDTLSRTGSELTEVTKSTLGIKAVFLLFKSHLTARPINPLPAFYDLKGRGCFSSEIRRKDDSILRFFSLCSHKYEIPLRNKPTHVDKWMCMDMGLLPSWEILYRPTLGGIGHGVIQLYPFLQLICWMHILFVFLCAGPEMT